MSSFTLESTADEVANTFNSEIRGKNIIITGASPKSLAFEAARAIATKQPALLVLAGRNTPLLEESKKEILAQTPDAKVRLLTFDLGNQDAVREAASQVAAYEENFDILINSGGVMAAPYSLTTDGTESQFATNHIGPFLFTNLLLPKLNPGARIVTVSSAAYQLGSIQWEDISFEKTPYNKWQAYAQSKAANILFGSALARKKGILSFSLHPGTIYTNITRYLTKEDYDMLASIPRPVKTTEQGAAVFLVAAFDPSIKDGNGGYVDEDNQLKPIPEAYPHAIGEENEERLWELSEQLVNQKF